MTWTYDPTQLLTTPMMQVRYLVGDTRDTDRQVQDEEIGFALTERPSVYGAAAIVCRALSAAKSRLVDTVDNDLRTTYSQQASAYARQAIYYEQRDAKFGGVIPVAGGLNRSDKIRMECDPNRLPPAFNIGMQDNYFPEAPEGNEMTPPALPGWHAVIDIGFDVGGVAEVQAALSSLPNAVNTRLRGYMTGAANTLRAMVQQNIAATFHSSGPLAQGVRSDVTEDSGGITARIAIENVPYARIQEQGGTVQIPELAPVNAKVLAFSTPARGAVAAIASRGAGGAIFAMHTKAHPVTIPEHPYARQALADYQQPFQSGIREVVRAVLGDA